MKSIKLLTLISLSLQGCFLSNKTECIKNYTFQIPISVIPYQSKYKVGDTLTISMVTDNTALYDSNDDRNVDFPNFDPNAWFLLPKIDSFPVGDGFTEHEVIVKMGYETEYIFANTLSRGLFFTEIDTSDTVSMLEYNIVLKEVGTYTLYGISEIDRNEDDICFPNKCNGCGFATGGISGEFIYDHDINEDILNANLRNNLDQYWSEREAQGRKSSPFHLKVEN